MTEPESKSDLGRRRIDVDESSNVTSYYVGLSNAESGYVRELTSFIIGIVKSAILKRRGDRQSVVVTLPIGRFTISVEVRYDEWPTPGFHDASLRRLRDIKPTPSSTDTIS